MTDKITIVTTCLCGAKDCDIWGEADHEKFETRTERELLELYALQAVSATYYYDLADNMQTVTDEQLGAIIEADGDEFIELIEGMM